MNSCSNLCVRDKKKTKSTHTGCNVCLLKCISLVTKCNLKHRQFWLEGLSETAKHQFIASTLCKHFGMIDYVGVEILSVFKKESNLKQSNEKFCSCSKFQIRSHTLEADCMNKGKLHSKIQTKCNKYITLSMNILGLLKFYRLKS